MLARPTIRRLELSKMTAEAMTARFDRETLPRIHATIPLEPATGALVALALASLA